LILFAIQRLIALPEQYQGTTAKVVLLLFDDLKLLQSQFAGNSAALKSIIDSQTTQPIAWSDEFVGPFSSWHILQAKGDGIADDTAALQGALNSLNPVLFIPTGTYKITSTLTVTAKQGISIFGEGPATTKLVWDGPVGGTLLHINACSYSRFNRLTFDGVGIADTLIDQSFVPGTPGAFFDTGNQYADNVFKNANHALQGGAHDIGASEVSVLRCIFDTIGTGIWIRNFNALDWWVWNCTFKDCGVGITNDPGAGAFHAYGCMFDNPTGIDWVLLNTGNFNFRDNFSTSMQFGWEKYYYTNAAQTRLQGNQIKIGTRTDGYLGAGLYQGNMGPLILTDNAFQSPVGATNPPVPPNNAPVFMGALSGPDLISVGNSCTVTKAFQTVGNDGSPAREIRLDDQVNTAIGLMSPVLPGVLPNLKRQIIEVPAGATSTVIQAAINQAAALNGKRPVVHLPAGSYSLDKTITVPPCDLQLVGDGFAGSTGTAINWGGAGSAIVLQGPSRVIVRDLYINAGIGTGIEIQNADQVGARVYLQQPQLTRPSTVGLLVAGLNNTLVELHDAAIVDAPGVGVEVIGGASPQMGRTAILSGSGGGNYLTTKVSHGGNLTIRDFWYDNSGGAISTFATASENSTLIVEGTASFFPPGESDPAIRFEGFSGIGLVMGNTVGNHVSIDSASNGNVWVVGNNFSHAPTWLMDNQSATARVLFNSNRRADPTKGSIAIPDGVLPDSAFVRTMLNQARNTYASAIGDLASGVTDVRLYRVQVELGGYCITIKP
jgi:hypothetical protein